MIIVDKKDFAVELVTWQCAMIDIDIVPLSFQVPWFGDAF